MKKKTIGMLLGSAILATASIAIAPIVLTSCSFNQKAKTPLKYQTQDLGEVDARSTLMTKTADEWANSYRNNPSELLDALEQYNYLFLKDGFSLEGAEIMNVSTEITKLPTYKNLVVTLENYNLKKSVKLTILNLYAFAVDFTPPTKTEYSFDQQNLSSIAKLNPEDISDAAWTNAINATQPDSPVIPFNLYFLNTRGYKDDSKTNYQLIYKINNQYEVQLGDKFSEFKPITVNIKLSPFLNKELKENFILDENETKAIFPNCNSYSGLANKASQTGGQVEIYNALAKYVESLDGIQPLRDCVNGQNVYNFEIMPLQINNGCQITFSSNPNSQNSEVFNYTFTLQFGNSQNNS